MKVEIRQGSFNPFEEIERHQSSSGHTGIFGATSCFIGTMRDFNDDAAVTGMNLEYYPGMTETHIKRICEQATEKWSLLDVLVIHRVGEINIGDSIVVIAVWATHRGDASDACRFIIEDLKSKAPFWKKEQLEEGDRWVSNNTSGYVKGED
jgi:molybdopterin synthase catalytic subunit